jgi:hypothetical protein
MMMSNVPDQESPLASGVAPAREAGSAGGMTEVPKEWRFAASACSRYLVISLFERRSGKEHQRKNERHDEKEDGSQIDPGN